MAQTDVLSIEPSINKGLKDTSGESEMSVFKY